jgi:hypothetical protein
MLYILLIVMMIVFPIEGAKTLMHPDCGGGDAPWRGWMGQQVSDEDIAGFCETYMSCECGFYQADITTRRNTCCRLTAIRHGGIKQACVETMKEIRDWCHDYKQGWLELIRFFKYDIHCFVGKCKNDLINKHQITQLDDQHQWSLAVNTLKKNGSC